MRCKKYQPSPAAYAPHHLNPAGDCRSCVYFSRYNCGMHPEANPASMLISLNMFAFDV